MRRTSLALAVVAAAGLSGCTRANERGAPAATPTATATKAPAKLVDPSTAPQNSPERTVLGFIRYLQLNTTPLAADLYHPRVVEELTPGVIVEALSSQVVAVQNASVQDLASERTRRGMLVTFSFRGAASTARFSFVLRESRGRWSIVYDTLLDGGLSYFAQGGEATARRLTKEEASRAVRRYRAVLLKIAEADERATGRAEPESTPAPTATPAPTPQG